MIMNLDLMNYLVNQIFAWQEFKSFPIKILNSCKMFVLSSARLKPLYAKHRFRMHINDPFKRHRLVDLSMYFLVNSN